MTCIVCEAPYRHGAICRACLEEQRADSDTRDAAMLRFLIADIANDMVNDPHEPLTATRKGILDDARDEIAAIERCLPA